MTRYRARPVDAVPTQVTSENARDVITWIRERGGNVRDLTDFERPSIVLVLRNGLLRANVGDWIVHRPGGGWAVCDDAEFTAEYEAAPDGEPEVWATRYGDLYRADPDGVWMWNLAGRIDGRLSGGEENPHAAGRRDDIEREAGPLVPVALPPYIPDPEDPE